MKPRLEGPLLLHQMITGYWLSQSVCTAARLGLADLLKSGPKGCAQLAREAGADPQALYRLMRALASIGLFAEMEPEVFKLAPLGQHLVSDAPGSLHAFALMHGDEFHWSTWGNLFDSIKTGEPAFQKVFKKSFFQYLAEKPELGRNFDQVMTELTRHDNDAILRSYPYPGTQTLVDVGGGAGSLIINLLQANPGMKGMLLDQPHVLETTDRAVRNAGLEGRCTLVGGNFFESVPAGGDTYLLKYILHDWNDEQARKILQNIRRVIGKDGRLLVIEQVLSPGNEPGHGKFLDLQMLLMLGGQERTEEEYRKLYEAAGFKLTRVLPSGSRMTLLEGIPA